jgi:uncharacterized cupin superfamily protein
MISEAFRAHVLAACSFSSAPLHHQHHIQNRRLPWLPPPSQSPLPPPTRPQERSVKLSGALRIAHERPTKHPLGDLFGVTSFVVSLTRLEPGACAGFKAGTGNAQQLTNDTAQEVVYLEIGDRTPGDESVL